MEKTLSDGSVQACVGADSAMVGEEVEELRALRSALSPPHFYDGDGMCLLALILSIRVALPVRFSVLALYT